MKKVLIFVLAIASFSMASAQNKGDKYVGGIIGVTTQSAIVSGNSANTTSFSIAPEFAFFVANRFRIGGTFNYTLGAKGDDITHSVEFGPEIAYYARLCDKFYYVPSLLLCFAYNHVAEINGVGFEVGLGLGSFEFRPTKHFGLALNLLTLSYAYLHYKSGGWNTNGHGIVLRLGVSPSVGVRYYF